MGPFSATSGTQILMNDMSNIFKVPAIPINFVSELSNIILQTFWCFRSHLFLRNIAFNVYMIWAQ